MVFLTLVLILVLPSADVDVAASSLNTRSWLLWHCELNHRCVWLLHHSGISRPPCPKALGLPLATAEAVRVLVLVAVTAA